MLNFMRTLLILSLGFFSSVAFADSTLNYLYVVSSDAILSTGDTRIYGSGNAGSQWVIDEANNSIMVNGVSKSLDPNLFTAKDILDITYSDPGLNYLYMKTKVGNYVYMTSSDAILSTGDIRIYGSGNAGSQWVIDEANNSIMVNGVSKLLDPNLFTAKDILDITYSDPGLNYLYMKTKVGNYVYMTSSDAILSTGDIRIYGSGNAGSQWVIDEANNSIMVNGVSKSLDSNLFTAKDILDITYSDPGLKTLYFTVRHGDNVVATPLPAALWLMLSGLCALPIASRRTPRRVNE